MKDPYKDLRYHMNVIKEEGLYPIGEFGLKVMVSFVRFFDHLFDHQKQ